MEIHKYCGNDEASGQVVAMAQKNWTLSLLLVEDPTTKSMMRDLPVIKEINEVCEGCLLEKQHR